MPTLSYKRNEDPRSTSDLFACACSRFDAEEAWDAIHELHTRGTPEVLNMALELCNSKSAKRRIVGISVLAQIGCEKRSFLNESVEALIKRLRDTDETVIAEVGVALGHRGDPRSIPHLVALKNHDNPRVRYGIAFGLCGQDAPEAINALIELSRDQDTDVRDWATFGLAKQTDFDSPELRDALLARLADPDPEVRGEAFIGLAKRKDDRVITPLQKELFGKFHGSWAVEAAKLLGNPSLCPFLTALREREASDIEPRFLREIDEAIAACEQKTN